MVSRKVVGLLCLVAAAYALPAQDAVQTENNLLDTTYADCLHKDTMSCIKYKLFSFVDKLGQKDTITVTEGVHIIKTEGGEPAGAPRALSSDDTMESLILNRVARFLETHTVNIDLKGSEIVNTVSSMARSLSDDDEDDYEEEGRKGSGGGGGGLGGGHGGGGGGLGGGKRKKSKSKNMMGPLMALAGLKMALLGKLAIVAIFLIAGKALIIGKIALVLSILSGIKKLFGGQGGGKQTTYEVVAHPHDVHGGGGGGGYSGDISGGGGGYGGGSSGHGGGWGRSLEAQKLAYRGQTQQ